IRLAPHPPMIVDLDRHRIQPRRRCSSSFLDFLYDVLAIRKRYVVFLITLLGDRIQFPGSEDESLLARVPYPKLFRLELHGLWISDFQQDFIALRLQHPDIAYTMRILQLVSIH